MSEKQAAFRGKARGQTQGCVKVGGNVVQQRCGERVVDLGQNSGVRRQDAANFVSDGFARERRVVAFEMAAGGALSAEGLQLEVGADRFRHRGFPVFFHQRAGGFHLLRVFVVSVCFVERVAGPKRVPVVAAVVRVPAQHVPKFLPGKLFLSVGGKNARGEQPRVRTGVFVELFPLEDAERDQEFFDAGDAGTPRGDVAAGAPKSAAA